jgi:hypothetical protein
MSFIASFRGESTFNDLAKPKRRLVFDAGDRLRRIRHSKRDV